MSDEFSEQERTAIHDRVEGWYNTFAKSPAFAALTESQQRKAGPIANYFTEYSFLYLDLAPAEWNCDAVCECCIEILPRKVSAELSFFEAIAPVLAAFFRFLGDQSLHPQGHALADTVEDIAEDIVSNAKDSGNWGMAKHLVMAAHEAGVNIGDQAEFNAFIAAYNMALASRFESSGPPPAAPPTSGNPYDPCPCGSGKKFKFCCQKEKADRGGAHFWPSPWL
jgi:hypothetical protein